MEDDKVDTHLVALCGDDVMLVLRKDPTNRATAATRLITIRRLFWQVEYPGRVSNDCHQSCGETLRNAALKD
jgi:hypothetical protein